MTDQACANHPAAAATWRCTSCGGVFCDTCVHSQLLGSIRLTTCRTCKGKCVPTITPPDLPSTPAHQRKTRPGFFVSLPGAFIYPFKGSGLLLMLTGMVFYILLAIAMKIALALCAAVFAGGYLVSYMFRIINTSGEGESELPDWPGFADWWEDIIVPFFQVASINVLCFLPAIAYALVGPMYDLFDPLILIGLGALGLFYQPMALMSVAMHSSLAGFSPKIVFRAIFKTFFAYLVTCIVMCGIFVVSGVGGLLTALIPIPFVGTIIQGTLSFYLLAVEMRILGLLYYTYEDRLGWFKDI